MASAQAEDNTWRSFQNVAAPGTPPRILYVNKAEQKLRVVDTYNCTTGQKDGGKVSTGDLRTPEGVYFVLGKVPGKLDMKDYGGIAYALNYPNPIDRLYGRTGYGIWIHSRGRAITSKETQGCIAVDLGDMGDLLKKLTPGTPVVLADTVQESNTAKDTNNPTALHLQQRTDEWNAAWSSRSDDFFGFYDIASYEKAQSVNFEDFRQTKEDTFSNGWLYIVHGKINVIQGPGYWVTWFSQFYKSANRTFEGTRRLYWIEKDGEYYIAGMEWILEPAKDITVAQRKVPDSVKRTAVAAAGTKSKPVAVASSDTIKNALKDARQDVKKQTNESKTPSSDVPATEPNTPKKPAITAATLPLPTAKPAQPAVSNPGKEPTPKPATDAATAMNAKQIMTSVMNFVEVWRKAWQKGDLDGYIKCYADAAVQQQYFGKRAIRNYKRMVWKNKSPLRVRLTNIRVFPQTDGGVTVTMLQEYSDTDGYSDKGIKTIVLTQEKDQWLILSETWKKMR